MKSFNKYIFKQTISSKFLGVVILSSLFALQANAAGISYEVNGNKQSGMSSYAIQAATLRQSFLDSGSDRLGIDDIKQKFSGSIDWRNRLDDRGHENKFGPDAGNFESSIKLRELMERITEKKQEHWNSDHVGFPFDGDPWKAGWRFGDFEKFEKLRAMFENRGRGFPPSNAMPQMEPVPIPASVWMLGSALGFLGWKARQKYNLNEAG